VTLCELGSLAPDFVLQDQQGAVQRLSQVVQDGPVVLFFYPKDETTVCTKEACGFRDQHHDFTELGARVFGVSQDSVESHASFAQNHRLPFSLLADPAGRVAASFGIKKVLGLLPGRATFVIDTERKVRLSFSSTLEARAHIEHALRAVRALS
jgi:peroxiredoxin Q/BCP